MGLIQRIAVLCPSRMRPDRLREAVASWRTRSVASDIFFAFQATDPQIQKNIEIAGFHPYIVCDDIGLAAKVNALYDLATKEEEYAAYVVLNDDQVIHTHKWDWILLERLTFLKRRSGHGFWILHWRDDIQNERLPQGFLTKEMGAVLGSFCPRGYMRHLYVDNFYKEIGQALGILHYMPEIFIEHNHFFVGKAPIDESYKQSNSAEAYAADLAQFERWKAECLSEIVQTIQQHIKRVI